MRGVPTNECMVRYTPMQEGDKSGDCDNKARSVTDSWASLKSRSGICLGAPPTKSRIVKKFY